jgi:hypothetical protein
VLPGGLRDMRTVPDIELLGARQRATCDHFQAAFSAMTHFVICASANGRLFTTVGADKCDRLTAAAADAERDWHASLQALGCDPPPAIVHGNHLRV